MNLEKLQKLLKFVEENNSWKNTLHRPNGDFSKPLIKYVRFDVDTRVMMSFLIQFDNRYFSCIEENYDEFEEEIYKYLNDETYKSKYMTIEKKGTVN